MRTTLLIVASFLFSYGWSQDDTIFSIGFEKDTIRIKKSFKEETLTYLKLKKKTDHLKNMDEYSLEVEVTENESTLHKSEYSLDYKKTLGQVDNIYLFLKKDTLEDRERKLHLTLKVKANGNDVDDKNTGNYKKIVVIIPAHKKEDTALKDYSYLSYVGTNFDLVDGVKAQNLFFATNVFIPPQSNRSKVGFYLSLYGNRAMSDIDSTGSVRRSYRQVRVTDSTYINYTEQSSMTTTRVSDNIGAYISPLIRIFKNKNKSVTDLNLYYSPSLEFVWRRTSITQEFRNPVNRDSTLVSGTIPGNLDIGNVIRRQYNEYSFNAGIVGLFLVLENKDISVRVHGSVGYSSNFYPRSSLSSTHIITTRTHDMFFSGRAWITEPLTGLTLQAEVTNTAFNPRPFFGATLSKAFKLDKLSGIFSPITQRSSGGK